jgi:membrane associated rhomboid family serine protease
MIAIIIITALVSGLGLLHPPIVEALSLNSLELIRNKKFYRMFTCALVHESFNHAATNLVIILFATTKLHSLVSYNYIVLVYINSILLSNLFVLIEYRNIKQLTACGASGGAFGLMAFGLAMGLPSCTISVVLACVLLICMLLQMQQHAGFSAHLGGAVAGLLCSVIYTIHVHSSFHISNMVLALGIAFIMMVDTYNNFKK